MPCSVMYISMSVANLWGGMQYDQKDVFGSAGKYLNYASKFIQRRKVLKVFKL